MQINSVNTYNNNRQTFCARVPQNIQNAVLRQAVEGGTESLNRAKAQIAKVQNWGKPTTVLETAFDMESGNSHLGINNFTISKMYGAGFKNQKGSLLDTFMSLSEKDILKAEGQIKAEVEHSKRDLAEKAMKNKNLMIKIAGEENPTATKFFEAVDKLSEEEIVNLRFNLDEPSKFSDGPILNFEF